MKQHRIHLQAYVKLIFVAALISLIGLVFTSDRPDNSAYTDDIFRVQLAIAESIDNDAELPNSQDISPDAIYANDFVIIPIVYASIIGTLNQVSATFTFKHLTHPRAPPLF